jgi:hypothetical protein
MSTVQLAVRDRQYAAALADLLQKDGSHDVLLVDSPRLAVDGIIVVDGGRPENLLLFETQPERFVVVTRKDAGNLSSVWDAGVRHVVFEGDSPATAYLAVVAAELRNPQPRDIRSAATTSFAGHSRRHRSPRFPLPILDTGTARSRSSFPHRYKPLP